MRRLLRESLSASLAEGKSISFCGFSYPASSTIQRREFLLELLLTLCQLLVLDLGWSCCWRRWRSFLAGGGLPVGWYAIIVARVKRDIGGMR